MASEWHYEKSGQKLGPISASELKAKAKSGELVATDLVWKDGMVDWRQAGRVKGLFDHTIANKEQSASPPPIRNTQVDLNNKNGPDSAPVTDPTNSNRAQIVANECKDGGAGWYYCQGNDRLGPLSFQQLQDFSKSGKLLPIDLVWHESLPDWIPASSINKLFPKNLFADLNSAVLAVKQQFFEEKGPSTSGSPTEHELSPTTTHRETQDAVAVEVVTQPRLPVGIEPADIVCQNRVSYRGGHPQHTEAAFVL